MKGVTAERTLALAKHCERGELTAAECDEVADILRYYSALLHGPPPVITPIITKLARFEDEQ